MVLIALVLANLTPVSLNLGSTSEAAFLTLDVCKAASGGSVHSEQMPTLPATSPVIGLMVASPIETMQYRSVNISISHSPQEPPPRLS